MFRHRPSRPMKATLSSENPMTPPLASDATSPMPGSVAARVDSAHRDRIVGFLPVLSLPSLSRPVRDYGSLDPVLGRIGSLEVRLATTTWEIRQAQRLRFKVFYKEMSASPNGVSL